jgi:hypothetical protein
MRRVTTLMKMAKEGFLPPAVRSAISGLGTFCENSRQAFVCKSNQLSQSVESPNSCPAFGWSETKNQPKSVEKPAMT